MRGERARGRRGRPAEQGAQEPPTTPFLQTTKPWPPKMRASLPVQLPAQAEGHPRRRARANPVAESRLPWKPTPCRRPASAKGLSMHTRGLTVPWLQRDTTFRHGGVNSLE